MDRRLPPAPGPYFVQDARRILLVEQRLDQLAKFRPQSQRYDNPPCWCETGTGWTIITSDKAADTYSYTYSYDGADTITELAIPAGYSGEGVPEISLVLNGVVTATLAADFGIPATMPLDIDVSTGDLLYFTSNNGGGSGEAFAQVTMSGSHVDEVIDWVIPV
jgi:hypothetical protein